MYKVIGSDGKEHGPADMETLQSWVRAGNVTPNTVLIDLNTGQQLQARQLLPLQPMFGMSATPSPPTPPLGAAPPANAPSVAMLSDVPRPTPASSVYTETRRNDSWAQNAAIIWLLLLFCTPIGLLLAWAHPRWSVGSKLAISNYSVILSQ